MPVSLSLRLQVGMPVCMYVCDLFGCMTVCMYVSLSPLNNCHMMYVLMYAYLYVCLYVCMFCMYVCMYVCVAVSACL